MNWWKIGGDCALSISVAIGTFVSCICIWTGYPMSTALALWVTIVLAVATVAVWVLCALGSRDAFDEWMDNINEENTDETL